MEALTRAPSGQLGTDSVGTEPPHRGRALWGDALAVSSRLFQPNTGHFSQVGIGRGISAYCFEAAGIMTIILMPSRSCPDLTKSREKPREKNC